MHNFVGVLPKKGDMAESGENIFEEINPLDIKYSQSAVGTILYLHVLTLPWVDECAEMYGWEHCVV